MSGGNKQIFKQFSINSVEDACLVLGSLISAVSANLDKYREYAKEATELLNNTDDEYIPSKEYDNINDKLLFRQREILKFTADHQKSSFSYIDLRKTIVKKQYVSSTLSDEISGILNEFLDVRNWSFHNPQSILVASKEAAEKNIPDELKGVVKPIPLLNPVMIQKTEKYELVMLASLVIHTEQRIEQFERILVSMKNDYQEMYDSISGKLLSMTPTDLSSKVQFVEVYRTTGLTDYQSDITQVSMAIQKSKYDGTDEKFNEAVVRMNLDDSSDE